MNEEGRDREQAGEAQTGEDRTGEAQTWPPLLRLREAGARMERGELDPLDLNLAPLLGAGAGTAGRGGGPEAWGEAAVLAARLLARKAEAVMPSPRGSSQIEEEAAALEEDGPEPDPEALAQRLAAYESFREVADLLREHESEQRRRFGPGWPPPPTLPEGMPPNLDLEALIKAFQQLWERGRDRVERIQPERFTMADARRGIFRRLPDKGACPFLELFPEDSTRLRRVITFLALLELLRLGELGFRQDEAGEIWIERRQRESDGHDMVAGSAGTGGSD